MAEHLDRRSFITGVAAVAAAAALPAAPEPVICGFDLAAPGGDQTFIVHMIDGRVLDVTPLDWLELARQEINDITGISSELFNGR